MGLPVVAPKWRNRQTRRSQKPLGGDTRGGSIPPFGTVGRLSQLERRDASWRSITG